MTETIVIKVGASIILIMIIYAFVIRNPLTTYIYTRNLKFTWIVFKAQFTMDEFTFAHKILNHPLNIPYRKMGDKHGNYIYEHFEEKETQKIETGSEDKE